MFIALSTESRREVDELLAKALPQVRENPASLRIIPSCTAGFDDLDGHTWEFLWIGPDYDSAELIRLLFFRRANSIERLLLGAAVSLDDPFSKEQHVSAGRRLPGA